MKYLPLFLILMTSCSYYKDDNIAEEILEGIIQRETGVDIDLTPSSPEIKKL